jgi:hypothetical protein
MTCTVASRREVRYLWTMVPAPPRLDDRTAALLAQADRRVAARDANIEIDRERLRQELVYGEAISYEVALEPDAGFAKLATEVAPRLAYYLKSKKRSATACRGVFLSLFSGEDLYFVSAERFFEAVRVAEGLDEAAWRAKVATWEAGA